MPIIEDRPREPQEWNHAPVAIGLSWHHVIPFSRLRDLWNAMVRAAQQTRLAEPALAIRQYMGLCGMPIRMIDESMNALRAHTLEFHTAETFRRLAAWPCWNIVEGPTIRMDDPGDAYFDRFTFGLTPAENERMGAVDSFYHRIAGLALAGLVPAGTLRFIADACSVSRMTLGRTLAPIAFRDTMWEQAGPGLWRKRRA